MRISRIVVLPEYQGIGIGHAFLNWAATKIRGYGYRPRIMTASPTTQIMLTRDKKWRNVTQKQRIRVTGQLAKTNNDIRAITVKSFEFSG